LNSRPLSITSTTAREASVQRKNPVPMPMPSSVVIDPYNDEAVPGPAQSNFWFYGLVV
jgi:hypothetical protein